MNTNAIYKLSYGVYVVSTWDNGRATGCTANSAMQITPKPATIAVSINHDNYTNECIEKTGKFALSILSEQSDTSVKSKIVGLNLNSEGMRLFRNPRPQSRHSGRA